MGCPGLVFSYVSLPGTRTISFQLQCSALNMVLRDGGFLPGTTSLCLLLVASLCLLLTYGCLFRPDWTWNSPKENLIWISRLITLEGGKESSSSKRTMLYLFLPIPAPSFSCMGSSCPSPEELCLLPPAEDGKKKVSWEIMLAEPARSERAHRTRG